MDHKLEPDFALNVRETCAWLVMHKMYARRCTTVCMRVADQGPYQTPPLCQLAAPPRTVMRRYPIRR